MTKIPGGIQIPDIAKFQPTHPKWDLSDLPKYSDLGSNFWKYFSCEATSLDSSGPLNDFLN